MCAAPSIISSLAVDSALPPSLPQCVKDLNMDFTGFKLSEEQLAAIFSFIEDAQSDCCERKIPFSKKVTGLAAGFFALGRSCYMINLSKTFASGSFKNVKNALFYNKLADLATPVVHLSTKLINSQDPRRSDNMINASRCARALRLIQPLMEIFPYTYENFENTSSSKMVTIQEKFDGDLQDYISKNGEELQESRILQEVLVLQLIGQLSDLHWNGLCHRDIKLNNVLYKHTINPADSCRYMKVAITDFDMAIQKLDVESGKLKHSDGSLLYYSPETWSAIYASAPVDDLEAIKPRDVWALGMVLYTILESSGSVLPWVAGLKKYSLDDLRKMVKPGEKSPETEQQFQDFLSMFYKPVSISTDDELSRVVIGMLNPDPVARLTALQACEALAPRFGQPT